MGALPWRADLRSGRACMRICPYHNIGHNIISGTGPRDCRVVVVVSDPQARESFEISSCAVVLFCRVPPSASPLLGISEALGGRCFRLHYTSPTEPNEHRSSNCEAGAELVWAGGGGVATKRAPLL
jgi:hypothetical protein